MDGIFSVKSDVFSYGVLVLEIVSGKKSRGTFGTESTLNLLSYVSIFYFFFNFFFLKLAFYDNLKKKGTIENKEDFCKKTVRVILERLIETQ